MQELFSANLETESHPHTLFAKCQTKLLIQVTDSEGVIATLSQQRISLP